MEESMILKAYLTTCNIEREMLKLDDRSLLLAALGTAIDAWCKEKGENPINIVNLLNSNVIKVNTMYGEIGSRDYEF